jgi:hypothetical protein
MINKKILGLASTFFLLVQLTSAQAVPNDIPDFPSMPVMPDFSNIIPNFPNIPGIPNMATNSIPTMPNGTSTGQIGGNVSGGSTTTLGVLKIDSIETQKQSGIANDNFADGFKYLFNLTVPTNELLFSMKFGDWVSSTNGAVIPAANNIRISSLQASSTAPIIITASSTYAMPVMTLVTDLDPNMAGRQIKVLVETKIPVNTANGSYSTSYGARSQ